jgi:GntR family transcriptional regulator
VDVPEINRRAPDPPYRQIAAWLRAQIAAGAYPQDVPLPSENELRDMFGVSRDSARHAVAVLRDEGLVYTIPTRGTYVIEPRPA